MKTFTISDIRSWKPCYDPSRHLPEDWQGTALDILQHETIPHLDKAWVVLREELLPLEKLQRFAIACACRVQHLMQDERSIKALDVAEAFLDKKATQEQLEAASKAAAGAAWTAEAAQAAQAAAEAARAAEEAAQAAAWAAQAAVWAAWTAWAAGAARAAREAARAAEEAWQKEELIKIFKEHGL